MPADGAHRRRPLRWWQSAGPPLIVLAIVIGVWELVSQVVMTPDRRRVLLPPPESTVQDGFLEWDHLSEILSGLWLTSQVTVLGLAISVVVGVTVAVIMSQARWVERMVHPYAVVLQTIPIIAIVPLIGLWFSFAFRSRVLVAVIISLFPIITNTLFGLKSVDRGLEDLFTLHRSSRRTRLWKLRARAAQPSFFTGLRIAAGMAVIGSIVGDFFFRRGDQMGLGRLLSVYHSRVQPTLLFTTIFFSSMLGLTLFVASGLLGRFMTRAWYVPARRTRHRR